MELRRSQAVEVQYSTRTPYQGKAPYYYLPTLRSTYSTNAGVTLHRRHGQKQRISQYGVEMGGSLLHPPRRIRIFCSSSDEGKGKKPTQPDRR